MSMVGLRTWFRALLGEREAILALATCPQAFGTGILLVLSAALAREYDGVDLLHEPAPVLLPLLASAVTGALFWLAFFRPWRESATPLHRVLGVFWASAPLAWLYGIPYERFLEPLAAVRANQVTLALVALLRVVWWTRVLAVWRGASFARTLAGVLCLADGILVVVSSLAPRPVTNIMGGVRGSPLEEAVGAANGDLLCVSIAVLPLLLIAAVTSRAFTRALPASPLPPPRSGSGLVRGAWLALFAWCLLAVPVQPEQARRRRIEADLRAGRIHEALDALSLLRPEDLPPAWDPPPHLYLGDDEPSALAVLAALREHPVPDWVADLFVPKFFHAWYWDDETPRFRLEDVLASTATSNGEDEARGLLELLASHPTRLSDEERTAVEDLVQRVRAGARLTPEPEADADGSEDE